MKNILIVGFLLLISQSGLAAKADTLDIPSVAMNKSYKAAVLLPDSYAKSKENYPVMYLLHGAYGHFRDWLKNTPDKMVLHRLADQYDMIIVMPEGENYSFYLDSPENKESQFETYITKEVIAKIDKTFRTVANKNGRVITGLSMGGHGAMFLSTRHPELFCAAGSMSGALDMGSIRNAANAENVNKLLQTVYPTPATDAQLSANAVVNMIDTIKVNGLPLIIDIGVDDFLIESNREFHRRMVYQKVPHEYTERPGAHTWEYWGDAVPFHALFFARILAKNGVTVK